MNLSEGRPRILLRLPNWVGDAVMATPAIAAVRGAFPAARIDGLAKPAIASLLFDNGMDAIIPFETNTRGGESAALRRFGSCGRARAGNVGRNKSPRRAPHRFESGRGLRGGEEVAVGAAGTVGDVDHSTVRERGGFTRQGSTKTWAGQHGVGGRV